jgi:hypothetical protein
MAKRLTSNTVAEEARSAVSKDGGDRLNLRDSEWSSLSINSNDRCGMMLPSFETQRYALLLRMRASGPMLR